MDNAIQNVSLPETTACAPKVPSRRRFPGALAPSVLQRDDRQENACNASTLKRQLKTRTSPATWAINIQQSTIKLQSHQVLYILWCWRAERKQLVVEIL
jgi:hypothetical protein